MWDNSVSLIRFDLSFGWRCLSLEHLSGTEHTHWLYIVSKLWCIEQRKLSRRGKEQVSQRMIQFMLASLWWAIWRRTQLCLKIVRVLNSVNFALAPLSFPCALRKTQWRVWLNWVAFSNSLIHHPPKPYLSASGIALFPQTAHLWRKKTLFTNQMFLRQPETLTKIREKHTQKWTYKNQTGNMKMSLIKNILNYVCKICMLNFSFSLTNHPCCKCYRNKYFCATALISAEDWWYILGHQCVFSMQK